MYYRDCPKCGETTSYTRKFSRDRAEKENRNCRSCSATGRPLTEAGKKKLSKMRTGEGNTFYGKKHSEVTKKKMKENHSDFWVGRKHKFESIQKMQENHSHCWSGKKHTEKSKKKMRLSRIKEIEEKHGQIMPNYNSKAIPIIRAKAKELGITDLRDAETLSGEFQVCGYFVDGHSKEKNIVIEYNEPFHKNQIERDERRKKEIIKELGCKFIEIWE